MLASGGNHGTRLGGYLVEPVARHQYGAARIRDLPGAAGMRRQ